MREVRLEWPQRPLAPPPPLPRDLQPGLQLPGAPLAGGSVRLVRGEALAVADRLLGEGLAGQIDLVHLDPPFGSEANYARARTLQIGSQNIDIELDAYGDTDGGDLAGYLETLYPVLHRAWQLLSERGSIYVHLDFRRGPYVRMLLDEIFGADNLVNEIIWAYGLGGSARGRFQRKHDVLYFYARDKKKMWFQAPREEATSSLLRGQPKQATDIWRTPDREDETRIERAWPDALVDKTLSNRDPERTGYPTQKPLALALRMVQASLPPGGMLLDSMAGSGTAGVAAALLGQRATLGDRSDVAIDCARGRAVAAGAAVRCEAIGLQGLLAPLPGPPPARREGPIVALGELRLPWQEGAQPVLSSHNGRCGGDLLSAWGVGVRGTDGSFAVVGWWDGGAQRTRPNVPPSLTLPDAALAQEPLFWLGFDVLGRGWYAPLA